MAASRIAFIILVALASPALTQTEYPVGSRFRLTAVSDDGWKFLRWDGDVSGTENPLDLTMNADISVTAVFEETAVLNLSTQGNGSIDVELLPPSALAFPEAEGFGSETPGGRGGRIIAVTNLNDSGPGSFREAVESSGPRIVVFSVAGTINLLTGINIRDPFLTVAGQTAPGGGITLRNDPSNTKNPINIKAGDVVIRYIRVRTGASTDMASSLGAIRVFPQDQVSTNVANVVIDHCSMSWGTDELLSTFYAAHHVTFQWNIVSEALFCSTNFQGCHSYGVLVGEDNGHSVSLHHNLIAHVVHRAPRVRIDGIVDVVNNVIYNWADFGADGWAASHVERGFLNYINNFTRAGPNTTTTRYYASAGGNQIELFFDGNITPDRTSNDMDQVVGVLRAGDESFVVSTRHPAPSITTLSALEARDAVLASAGASARLACDGGFVPRRDTVDARVVADVVNGAGRIIDDPSEVGGWPALEPGTPCVDTDGDGMPDPWEIANGLDPGNPSDGPMDRDGDGYTNVEEYLNSTEP